MFYSNFCASTGWGIDTDMDMHTNLYIYSFYIHLNVLIITSTIRLHFSCCSSLCLSPLYRLFRNCFVYMYKSFLSFCIYLYFCSCLCIWFFLVHITAHALMLLCSHFMVWFVILLCVCALSVISVHWPNATSALSCCHCALTWFKFKLACMSLANQMLCVIIYGWALSEIKGCCQSVTDLCSPCVFTLILAYLECSVLVCIKLWWTSSHQILQFYLFIFFM